VASPIEDPSDGAPSRRRFQPHARRKNEPLTLPVATPRGRGLPSPPEPLPPPFRQKERVSRPEAPSLDELPARRSLSRPPRTRTRHRTSGFATRGRLPTLFRPSLHEEGLDPAAFAGSSPASARRHAPLVDFCNRNDPQARLRIGGTRFPLSVRCFRTRLDTLKTVRRLLSEWRSRVVTGQGLDWIFRLSPGDPQLLSPRLRA
jgi:hypothetical protein